MSALEDTAVCVSPKASSVQNKREDWSTYETGVGGREGGRERRRKFSNRSISFFSTHSYQKTNKKNKNINK